MPPAIPTTNTDTGNTVPVRRVLIAGIILGIFHPPVVGLVYALCFAFTRATRRVALYVALWTVVWTVLYSFFIYGFLKPYIKDSRIALPIDTTTGITLPIEATLPR